MKKQKIVFLIFVCLIFLPCGVNAMWAAGGPQLLYWGARYLKSLLMLLLGLALILLPFFPQILLDKNDERPTISWKRHILVIFIGIVIILLGAYDLRLLTKRLLVECINMMECVR